MMLCNPSEPLTGSTGDTSTFNPTPGTMFVFSTTGNTGDFSPGVFNLLQDANQDNSDPAVGKLLAQQTANLCSTAGTSPAQGQKTNATKIGINVRFDQQPNGNVTGLDQTPAPIKIDGYVPRNGTDFCDGNLVNDTPTPYSNCATDQTISCALPRDQTFTSVGGSGGSQIGGGVALTDLEAYWSKSSPRHITDRGYNAISNLSIRGRRHWRCGNVVDGRGGTARTFVRSRAYCSPPRNLR